METQTMSIEKPLKDLDEWQDWKRDQITAENEKKKTYFATTISDSLPDAPNFNPINASKRRDEFRNYKDSARHERVQKFYTLQHTNQTFAFVKEMEEKYTPLTQFKMGLWDALEYLDAVIDDSDPDTNLTQMDHALQTGEACRRKWPGEEYDWFHLTGLIHDLGKILSVTDAAKGLVGVPQWAVVGDTFPVGLPFSDKNVFHESFQFNPDHSDPRYNTGLGVYDAGCGLSNVHMCWGHDEYLYRVIVGNNVKLPVESLYMIRYHSFYPWHRENAYQEILDDQDRSMLKAVLEFNECDLYSKATELPNKSELIEYYQNAIRKYFPATLNW